MQNLIVAKYFNRFLHFLFLIKSTKKFSFEPKLKDQKIKLVCESSFLYFWKKMDCVSYKIHHEIKDISRVKLGQWSKWEKAIFLKKFKILLLVCSINSKSAENSIDNSSIQIFILNLRLLFVAKEKNTPNKISHSPHWGNKFWTEFFWTFISSLIIYHK